MAGPQTTSSTSPSTDPSAILAELLERAAAGQSWAKEELSAQCLPQLTAFAKARGAADPEGIADTVLVDFLGRLDRLAFETPSQMWSYLYRVARSRVIDERRATKPVELRERESMEAVVPAFSGLEDDVAERHYVDDLLASLTSEQREILEMRFLDDLSIEETANRTGRTLTAVKGLQRRAIRALTAAALLAVIVIGGLALALTGRDRGIPTVSEGPAPTSGFSSDRAVADDESTIDVDVGEPLDAGDTAEPDTALTMTVFDPEDPASAEFHFEGADDRSEIERFECRLDGGPYEPCASPVLLDGLGEGRHVFEVRAVDGAGNTEQTPAQWFWLVERPAGVPVGLDLGAMRSSDEVLNCLGAKGTWAELTEAGFDVMVGTDGDDVIDVSSGDRPDVVLAGDGNDTIITGDGDDRVCAGPGNDSIRTGNGKDRISASAGNDTIDAGGNDDRVWGGGGTDTLVGGGGNDRLDGEAGTDHLDGSQGNDQLEGGEGADVLVGGPGRDRCLADDPGQDADKTNEPATDQAADKATPDGGDPAEPGETKDEPAADGEPAADEAPEPAPTTSIPPRPQGVDDTCEAITPE